jgi:NAD(P)-dependent dehydrogenase (short-subunit alcohol dehydrogenase family)
VDGVRDSGSPFSAAETTQSLQGQIAWVVGGVGTIGRGICRGMLKAGATVIVNSGHQGRLDRLREDLGQPQNLIGVCGTMRPSGADKLVNEVMGMTNARLHHVVAHSGVRWWAPQRGGVELQTDLAAQGASDIHQDRGAFSERASLLPVLHFTAAQLLLPHLARSAGATYTFVTGGAGERRSIEAQVNTHGVWGVAAALRESYAESAVRVSELRVDLKIDRPAAERALDPRERPLSADLGELCAGIAAGPPAEGGGLHKLDAMEHVHLLKARFPCPSVVEGLPLLWHWQKGTAGGKSAAA